MLISSWGKGQTIGKFLKIFTIINIIFLLFISSTKVTQAEPGFEVNIFHPDSIGNPGALTKFGQTLGLKFSSALWYLDWSDSFEPEVARGFQSQGAIPMLVWQPQSGANGVSFDAVNSGRYDSYLNSFADSVKGLGFPIRIDLAPEMNSDWQKWGIGNAGNNSENFKAFWRHVVTKFRDRGANNVRWIFAPNIHYWGERASFSELYPGDEWVDYVGLDGYNWGTSQSWSSWQSFFDVFGPSYNDITGISSKPLLITETASTEKGGSKAAWISEMFRDIPSRFPRLVGVYWFNINKETDWRIDSSAASKQAFAAAARGNYSLPPTTQKQANTDDNQNATENSPQQNKTVDNPQTETKTEENSSIQTKDQKFDLPLRKTTFYDPDKSSLAKKIKGIYITLADDNFSIANIFDKIISPQIQVLIFSLIALGSLIPILVFI